MHPHSHTEARTHPHTRKHNLCVFVVHCNRPQRDTISLFNKHRRRQLAFNVCCPLVCARACNTTARLPLIWVNVCCPLFCARVPLPLLWGPWQHAALVACVGPMFAISVTLCPAVSTWQLCAESQGLFLFVCFLFLILPPCRRRAARALPRQIR